MTLLPSPESPLETIATRNPVTGLIEIINAATGAIVAIQSSYEFIPGNNPDRDPTKSILVTTEQGHTIELEAGPAVEHYMENTTNLPSRWKYYDTVGQLICEYLATGGRITKMPKHFPPYSVVARWRRDIPKFRSLLEDALKDRADHFHDKALDYLQRMEESGAEDRASVARVQLDAIKWMAQVGNNDRYGNKTKVSGDPQAPLQIILDTGIRRESPPLEASVQEATPALESGEDS